MTTQETRPSVLRFDSGVNGSACHRASALLHMPPQQAQREISRLAAEENVLFVPFTIPLSVMAQLQGGDLENLPFYTAVFSAVKTIAPDQAGITESMAANLMTARQMPETRCAVSTIVRKGIPFPVNPAAQVIHAKLSQGRDVDMVADCDPSRLEELATSIAANCLKTYPGSQVVQNKKDAVTVQLPTGEKIDIITGYFHDGKNNPFLHIQKEGALIHFKPFSFQGVANPYDVISWDRAGVHINGKNQKELLKQPPQKIPSETYKKLVDRGIFFTNGIAMQEMNGPKSSMSLLLGTPFLDYMGSPMTLIHKDGLTQGNDLYLSFPRTVARIVRKAVEHEANLGTTVKGLFALKQNSVDTYATPAIDPTDRAFLREGYMSINNHGGLSVHLSLLQASLQNEVAEAKQAIASDCIAATIQNPGRMWRYLVGTEFYTIFPLLRSLTREQRDAINMALHAHDPQLQEVSPFIAGSTHPDHIQSELEYEALLGILTHPKAEIWKTKDRKAELSKFDHGVKKVARILQQYVNKPEDLSDFEFVTSLFSI